MTTDLVSLKERLVTAYVPQHEALAAIEALERERDGLAYFLKIYDHAHGAGNSVPPDIVAATQAALTPPAKG